MQKRLRTSLTNGPLFQKIGTSTLLGRIFSHSDNRRQGSSFLVSILSHMTKLHDALSTTVYRADGCQLSSLLLISFVRGPRALALGLPRRGLTAKVGRGRNSSTKPSPSEVAFVALLYRRGIGTLRVRLLYIFLPGRARGASRW